MFRLNIYKTTEPIYWKTIVSRIFAIILIPTQPFLGSFAEEDFKHL